MKFLFVLAALPLLCFGTDFARDKWPAEWIRVPQTSPSDYGVYHFRRSLTLNAKPDRFVVYVSGDNRYELFVNGRRVSWGPARSDLYHWRYEVVDVAPQLHAGTNVLAAVAWNDGPYRAVAQNTNETGFLLQAEAPENAQVNTNKQWKCIQDHAYSPAPWTQDQDTGYHAVGANERVDGSAYPWGWKDKGFDDSSWIPAMEVGRASPRDASDGPNRWMLTPRYIPLEEERIERLRELRHSEGAAAPAGFPLQQHEFAISANTRAVFLLDQTYLTTAYPELTVSGGRGASVTLRYAETLYDKPGPNDRSPRKSNRNETEGKVFYGTADTFLPDGEPKRTYRPLFWRTFRYLQLVVQTAGSPLTIDDIRGVFTAYPFEGKARITVSDPAVNQDIQEILTTGWRTARLCAHETYMDCPYYEQLQYAGDARIQMMISLYMSGDSRLMKNGIELLNSSRTAEGATYSRAPSRLQQYIPPFSLWWIGMVHDYWMYVDDAAFVKSMLPGVRSVLSFFAAHQKASGSLERLPWWNFVDWTKHWRDGVAPGEGDGSSSAAIDLQLLLGYRWAAELERALGSGALAEEDRAAAEKLKATILNTDWDSARGLFADQPSHRTYSQQANTLAVLAHVVRPEEVKAVVEKTFSDTTLEQSSIYFRAYTNATLREAHLGDRYLESLGPWREMLRDGLTTWSEWNGPDTRSDCHAWGASPNFEIFRTLVGVESAAPGFRKVRIAPNIGTLKRVSASMPHPEGEIALELSNETRFTADVRLPQGISGEFVWYGSVEPLHAGQNHLQW
ncbi:MAG: alpha-L-rhamnosidase N-terminal domain-containing protein [Acidobacteriaceae bacterium]|nr:alpha-L-rhamnosidase N-terminal domain-containing protein [Acidobacteriaceae bacterium]